MKKRIPILLYFLILAAYYLTNQAIQNTELEFRFWVDVLVRIVFWFVFILFFGIYLFRKRKEFEEEKKEGSRAAVTVLLAVGGIALVPITYFYLLFQAFSLTEDEVMPDGNLVVTVSFSERMESSDYYAEPVAFLFRRKITMDDAQIAKSLSKIYGVEFQTKLGKDGKTVYISEAYPGIETNLIMKGFTETSYLYNDLKYAVTSETLERHKDIFEKHGVKLTTDIFGESEERPEGIRKVNTVPVTEENLEEVSEALAEFIRTTLKEDKRGDGKSLWTKLDGSIFLKMYYNGVGEEPDSRNIPFSLRPAYSWIYGKDVRGEEIREELSQDFAYWKEK